MSKGKPVILLAFANDDSPDAFLRFLRSEMEELESILLKNTPFDVRIIPYATVDLIMDRFQNFHDRVIAFHYAGHANSEELMLLGKSGKGEAAHAEALADFLGHQKGLQLVFLNGCATQAQVHKLLEVGINHVIATKRPIGDERAKDFACRFYKSLSKSHDILRSFEEAKANIQTSHKDIQIESIRSFERVPNPEQSEIEDFSWKGFQRAGTEDKLIWDKTGTSIYPKQLNTIPGINDTFIGREKELADLQEKLQGDKPLLLLNGLGGIGKTTLAGSTSENTTIPLTISPGFLSSLILSQRSKPKTPAYKPWAMTPNSLPI